MKKLGIIALTMAVGSGMAFAASLSVPWFVDNAPVANGIPGQSKGVTGLITLKSNRTDTITCSIAYFAPDGTALGPSAAEGNTFTIAPLSALAFRPVAFDPATTPGGQEEAQGLAVPDRPMVPDSSGKTGKNGSITIEWAGDPTDVQGQVAYFQTTTDPNTGAPLTFSYSHLLPPGL